MNVFATSPAHGPARAARAELEAVAGMLRESSAPFDRKGIADRLMRAIRALYAVLDTPLEAPAHHDGLVECTRVIGEARQMLAPFAPAPGLPVDPALGRAWDALESLHGRVRRAADEVVDAMLARRSDLRGGPRPEAPRRPFQASMGLPRLHALARSPLAPPLDLAPASVPPPRKKRPPPPRKPSSVEELRAAASTKPTPPVLPPDDESPPPPATKQPIDDGELLRRVARDCLEDIAALRGLRKPIPSETWLDQVPFEQRLLENVDAFAAFGEAALPSITLFHAEAPAPDPARAFALALTLGCIEGTDTADVAVSAMTQSAPAEMSGFVEGFLLAPSPAIDVELQALLDAPNPALAGVAIDVLGARGALPPDAPERILPRRDAALTRKLAGALGRSLPKTKATQTLVTLIEDHPDLFLVAAESLLRRGDGEVRQRLRQALRTGSPDVARLLAIAGRPDDLPALLACVAATPVPALVRALGRHGHVDALAPLAALLDAKDEDVVGAAVAALDMITNAGLRETKDVPWTPDYVPPDGAPPPTRKVPAPIVDRLVWERWLAGMRGRLDPRSKLRGGAPFHPDRILDELEGPTASELRDEAALELVIATGVGMRFTTRDWVARQRQQLSEIRAHVRSLGGTPGGWWFAGAALTSR